MGFSLEGYGITDTDYQNELNGKLVAANREITIGNIINDTNEPLLQSTFELNIKNMYSKRLENNKDNGRNNNKW